jgi:hypothetical protein
MAAAGAASIIITDANSGARARVSHSLHGHGTQAPPNIEIPAATDPRLARAAQHRKTLFGALPEQTRLALLREAMPCERIRLRQQALKADLTHEKWHPARGV